MSHRARLALLAAFALTFLTGCGDDARTLELEVGEHLVSAGQPSAERLRTLKNDEFTLVLNLRPETEHPYDEAAVCAEVGLPYAQVGVDKKTITDAAVRAQVYDVFAEVESAGGRVYAHCKSGNRVGALWALYLAERKGVAPAEALAAGKAAGMTRLEPFVRKTLGLD